MARTSDRVRRHLPRDAIADGTQISPGKLHGWRPATFDGRQTRVRACAQRRPAPNREGGRGGRRPRSHERDHGAREQRASKQDELGEQDETGLFGLLAHRWFSRRRLRLLRGEAARQNPRAAQAHENAAQLRDRFGRRPRTRHRSVSLAPPPARGCRAGTTPWIRAASQRREPHAARRPPTSAPTRGTRAQHRWRGRFSAALDDATERPDPATMRPSPRHFFCSDALREAGSPVCLRARPAGVRAGRAAPVGRSPAVGVAPPERAGGAALGSAFGAGAAFCSGAATGPRATSSSDPEAGTRPASCTRRPAEHHAAPRASGPTARRAAADGSDPAAHSDAAGRAARTTAALRRARQAAGRHPPPDRRTAFDPP